jgi:uncharacterized SAM-dependent methyltransferase
MIGAPARAFEEEMKRSGNIDRATGLANETKLLEERAGEMAQALGQGIDKQPVLVEFGAGNLRKVGPLLEALHPPAYIALDISADHLQQSCVALQARHPAVPVLGICCDYSQLHQLPHHPLLNGQR